MRSRLKPKGPIDWAEIRGRLAAVGAHAAAVDAPPEAERDLLLRRARILARPLVEEAGDGLELVTFTRGRETFAMECRAVLAVFRLAELSPLPGAEPPVVGLTVWRGDLLTVLDLAGVLDASGQSETTRQFVLVVGAGRGALGVLADVAPERLILPVAEVRTRGVDERGRAELVRGMTAGGLQLLDDQQLARFIEADSI